MSKYGIVLEEVEEFDHRYDLYRLLTFYFDNPTMTKIKENDNMSIYSVRLQTGLVLDNKYLLLLVKNDRTPVGSKKEMKDLKWSSLQTRMIRDKYDCLSFNYKAKKTEPFIDMIYSTQKNDKLTTYKHPKYPFLEISLLNTESVYSDKGSIFAALETYKTILSLR